MAMLRVARNVVIVIAVLMVIGYSGQTIKAVTVKKLRLKWALEEGKISEQEYANSMKHATFLEIFLDPKYVISVD